MKENLSIFENFVRERETNYLDDLRLKLKKLKANNDGSKTFAKSIISVEKQIAEEEKRLGL